MSALSTLLLSILRSATSRY